MTSTEPNVTINSSIYLISYELIGIPLFPITDDTSADTPPSQGTVAIHNTFENAKDGAIAFAEEVSTNISKESMSALFSLSC